MHALIMTATIAPPADATGLVRADPKVRLEDYKSALQHYAQFLGKGLDRIYLFDNSNWGTTELEETVSALTKSDAIRIVSYAGLDYSGSYGRCYGEMRLLSYAMEHPDLRELPGDTIFWKVTGRYKVLNLRPMIRSYPRDCDLYIDLRNGSSPWFDMRVMAWNQKGFQATLAHLHDEIREDLNNMRPGEETAFAAIQSRLGSCRAHTAWREEPLIDGVRAFDNKNWSQGRQLVTFALRQIQRKVLRRVVF